MDEELGGFLIIIVLIACDDTRGGGVIQPFCSTGTVLYLLLLFDYFSGS